MWQLHFSNKGKLRASSGPIIPTLPLTAHDWQNVKDFSWLVFAMKFIGMKKLVQKVANILKKIRFMWICGIWGNFFKIWYFVNNCLIEVWI